MNILIAPDKFKACLTALEVAKAIESGIKKSNPDMNCVIHPMADGGDGSAAVLHFHLDLKAVEIESVDAADKKINGIYYTKNDEAFIDLASFSGLALLNETEKNPGANTTRGTGIAIQHALNSSCNIINLFLGGSATNDAGLGIANELGYQFMDAENNVLDPIGNNLIDVNAIIPPKDKSDFQLNIICDVHNPFTGSSGAVNTYANQKGADDDQRSELEKGMVHFKNLIQQNLKIDLNQLKGSGAAGGIAGGLHALFDGKIIDGAQYIAKKTNLTEKIKASDFIISGEGQIDNQTLQGKLISTVANMCKAHQKPFGLLAGHCKLTKAESLELGSVCIDTVRSLASSDEDSFKNASKHLSTLASDVISIFFN